MGIIVTKNNQSLEDELNELASSMGFEIKLDPDETKKKEQPKEKDKK